MNKPFVQPQKGQVINIGGIWSDYCKGLISAECVSWAYLVGLDVFSELTEVNDINLLNAVYNDTDGYEDKLGDDELIEMLKKSPNAFRFWWAAHSRLNEPAELYDACYLLADKHQSPSDFILERVSEPKLREIVATL